MTVEFLDLPDLRELMELHGEKILDLVHSQILAHNFRGQHRATAKDGKFVKADDHVYSMVDFIKGMTAGRMGEPSKKDLEMGEYLSRAIGARVKAGEDREQALTALVEFDARTAPGWRYDEPLRDMEEFAVYARALRLYKASLEKNKRFA